MLDPNKIKNLIDEREDWVNKKNQVNLMRGSFCIRDDAVYPNSLYLTTGKDFGDAIKAFSQSYVNGKIQETTVELNCMGIK